MEIVAVFGLPAAAVVVLIVEGLKLLGMPLRFAPWAALAVSLALAGLLVVRSSSPEATAWVDAVLGAALIWLVATGVYEKSKDVGALLRT